MKLDSFTINAYDAQICGVFLAPDEIKGAVVLVHGFGEHSGRYLESVVPTLVNASMAVVLYDNIGHGKSGGKQGHCPSYGALLDILDAILAKAKSLFPEMPLFLYGHSMGGNLVLNYALRRKTKLAGVIATSSYLRLAFQPPKWKMILGKVMLKIMPSITLPAGLDPSGISRIKAEVERYKSDPLIHDKISPMYSFPIMDAGEWAIQNASQLTIDTLLLHGAADPIIDCNGTKEFHQNANNTTLKLFEGGFHELHHDLCKAEMLAVINGWLRSRV